MKISIAFDSVGVRPQRPARRVGMRASTLTALQAVAADGAHDSSSALAETKKMVEAAIKEFKDFLKKYHTAKDKFLKHRKAANVIIKNLDRSYNRSLDSLYEEAEDICENLIGINDKLVDSGGKSMLDPDTYSDVLEWLNDRINRAADWGRETAAN